MITDKEAYWKAQDRAFEYGCAALAAGVFMVFMFALSVVYIVCSNDYFYLTLGIVSMVICIVSLMFRRYTLNSIRAYDTKR